jgi:hypothetical protein
VGASANFSIIFSPGKVEDVKFLSGNEKLKPMPSSILFEIACRVS